MLVSQRNFIFPELGVSSRSTLILHRAYRISVAAMHGASTDLGLLSACRVHNPEAPSNSLHLSLGGDAGLRWVGSVANLRYGECSSAPISSLVGMRLQGSVLLSIQWQSGTLAPALPPSSPARISRAGLLRLQALVLPLIGVEGCSEREAAGRSARILRVLRAEGLPFETPDAEELGEEVPEPMRRVSAAMDRGFASISHGPTVADLEATAGLSSRSIQKWMEAFHQRYAFNTQGGWRETLHRTRLILGAALMSAEQATTARVAQALGYGAPRSFNNALLNAGFPSPGELRRLVLAENL